MSYDTGLPHRLGDYTGEVKNGLPHGQVRRNATALFAPETSPPPRGEAFPALMMLSELDSIWRDET